MIQVMMKNVQEINNNPMSAKIADVQRKTGMLLQQYNNILQVLLIPVFAFFSWLFLGRKRFNYAENIVLHTAASAQMNTLSMIPMGMFLLLGGNRYVIAYAIIGFAVLLFSFALNYRQFFGISWPKSILFAVLVYLCGYLIQMLIITVIMLGYLLMSGGI